MVRFWRVGLALCPTSHPRLKWPLVRMRHRGGNVLRDQAFYERLRASPLNPMESATHCGSRCGAAGRRPVSRRASPVYAAFSVAVHGAGCIRKHPCGPGWNNEPVHTPTDSVKWHEGTGGCMGAEALSTRRWAADLPTVQTC